MEILLSLKFNEECKIISVDDDTSFSFLQDQAFQMWPHINIDLVTFRYSVGSISNAILGSDTDIRNLLVICAHCMQKIVSVVIRMDQDPRMLVKSSNFGSNTRNPFGSNSCVSDSTKYASPSLNLLSSSMSEHPNTNVQVLGPTHILPHHPLNHPLLDNSVIPSYDICPTIEKTALLSDCWVDLIGKGVGTIFNKGAHEFRKQLVLYATHQRFNFKYIKNDGDYIYVACKERTTCGCLWFVKGKRLPVSNAFQIYKANLIHKCVGREMCNKNKRFGPKIIGNLLEQEVRSNPKITARQIVEHLRIHYGVPIPYYKGYRTTDQAHTQLFGDFDNSYNELQWYSEAVKRTNPGSVVTLEVDAKTHHFERVFFAFKVCIDGFKHCRPVLFIDGTFLVGRAKGILLTAVAKDADNGLFPLAITVVSSENTSNWKWFLEQIRDHCKHEKPIRYLSDRNTGLLAAFPLVYENPLHYFCLFHLLLNLRGRYAGGRKNAKCVLMVDLFRECAYAPDKRIFDEKIAIFLAQGGKKAVSWLKDLPCDRWAVAFSPDITRYGEMTSNAAESFNSWLRIARGLPITHMVDYIRTELGRLHFDRRTTSSSWTTVLCSTREYDWWLNAQVSKQWKVTQCNNYEFEVGCSPTVTVDLKAHTCTCSRWQILGFPCAHLTAVVNKHGLDMRLYVDSSLFVETYRQTYMYEIHPVPETERYAFQPQPCSHKILPPILKRRPGRPKGTRYKSFGEFPKPKKPTIF